MSAPQKQHPLSMRLAETDIAIIDRAASLHRRSRTDFIRDASVRAAEAALLESTLVHMSADGYAAFHAALAGPVQPAPEMADMFARSPPWETPGR